MNTDELEQKTREQIRELQEEYRQRVEPLQKVLVNIYEHKSVPPFIVASDTAKSFTFRSLDRSAYVDSMQKEMNRMYRAMVDAMPVTVGPALHLQKDKAAAFQERNGCSMTEAFYKK